MSCIYCIKYVNVKSCHYTIFQHSSSFPYPENSIDHEIKNQNSPFLSLPPVLPCPITMLQENELF